MRVRTSIGFYYQCSKFYLEMIMFYCDSNIRQDLVIHDKGKGTSNINIIVVENVYNINKLPV